MEKLFVLLIFFFLFYFKIWYDFSINIISLHTYNIRFKETFAHENLRPKCSTCFVYDIYVEEDIWVDSNVCYAMPSGKETLHLKCITFLY